METKLTLFYPLAMMVVLGIVGFDILMIILAVIWSVRDQKRNANSPAGVELGIVGKQVPSNEEEKLAPSI